MDIFFTALPFIYQFFSLYLELRGLRVACYLFRVQPIVIPRLELFCTNTLGLLMSEWHDSIIQNNCTLIFEITLL